MPDLELEGAFETKEGAEQQTPDVLTHQNLAQHERIRDLEEVLKSLVACNDQFWAGATRDQAAAYYAMIKGKDKLWAEARTALALSRPQHSTTK